VDGSWEADTVQENRPLATDLSADGSSRLTATQHHNGRSLPTSPSLHHLPACHNLSHTGEREGYIHHNTHTRTQVSSRLESTTFHRHQFGSALDCSHVPGVSSGAVEGDERRIDLGETQWTLTAVRKPPDTLKPLFSVVGFFCTY